MRSGSGNLTVTLQGKGKVTLRQSNFVTAGGEASIYKTGDLIAKLYTDPAKMVRDRMSDKIAILSRIKNRFIVSPIDLVLDQNANPIGYYMAYADDTEPLSRVFTTAYRQRSNFTDSDAIDLVHNMREVVNIAHQNGCVLVDANELNWLMHKAQEAEPRLVDLDGCQIGQRWPASVIMPSIRDFHTQGFDERSDWFSWGVVSFQIFSGIHPYKGKLDPYQMNQMEQRMRDNASVFSRGIHLNAAVRDFSCIPSGLLSWYEATFQHGERVAPPSPRDTRAVTTVARTLRQTISTGGSMVFEKLFEGSNDPVIRVFPCGIALRRSGQLVELQSKRTLPATAPPDAEIIRTNTGWLVAASGKADLYEEVTLASVTKLSLAVKAKSVIRQGNRLFAVIDQGFAEIKLLSMGAKSILTLQTPVWETLPSATEWFPGMGIQNALGAKFFVLPWDDDKVSFVRCRELDDVTVVTAKAGPRFVSAIALTSQGQYQKFEFTLDRNYQGYTIWTGDADTPDLNLAILPNGVCATIVEDGELTIFVPANGKISKISDKTIATDMMLATWGDKVIYIQAGDVWWVRVK